MLRYAVKLNASDIHIEPFETFVRVRLRGDGSLHRVLTPPASLGASIVSRVKVQAEMDISERRKPQDGQIEIAGSGEELHFRVSTLPVVHGEKCVIRLLRKEGHLAVLSRLGFTKDQFALIKTAAALPQGLILVTGPTGSGKTTTLHAVLNHINDPDINIMTIEDPVEQTLPGINHVQVQEKGAVACASAPGPPESPPTSSIGVDVGCGRGPRARRRHDAGGDRPHHRAAEAVGAQGARVACWRMTFFALALACTTTEEVEAAEPFQTSLTAETALDVETGTALTVTWTTEAPTDAAIELGLDDQYGERVTGWSSEDGLSHAVVIAGLSPQHTWHWRATSTDGASVATSSHQTFTPAAAPAELPELVVTGETDQLVVTPVIGARSFAAVYNGDGVAVWWRELATSFGTFTQVRLSADGTDLLVMAQLPKVNPDMAIYRYPIAGGDPVVTTISGGHHDFSELSTGGYIVLVHDTRAVEGVPVEGDALVEFAEDGTRRDLWSAWDLGGPADVEALPEMEAGPRDWTHINSFAVRDGLYWLSSYLLENLLVVDARTGALVAEIGGTTPDVTLVGGGGFGPQHAPVPTEAGFLVFNNRPLDDVEPYSEAAEYTLDLATREYSRVWNYDAERLVATPVLGNVEASAGGGHLVGWGSAGVLTLLNDDHELVWEGRTPLGSAFGYAHPIEGLSGPPS